MPLAWGYVSVGINACGLVVLVALTISLTVIACDPTAVGRARMWTGQVRCGIVFANQDWNGE